MERNPVRFLLREKGNRHNLLPVLQEKLRAETVQNETELQMPVPRSRNQTLPYMHKVSPRTAEGTICRNCFLKWSENKLRIMPVSFREADRELIEGVLLVSSGDFRFQIYTSSTDAVKRYRVFYRKIFVLHFTGPVL